MMNLNRIILRSSIHRLWFTSNPVRTIYTAQPDSSPLQIYRNKVQAHEVCCQGNDHPQERELLKFSYVLIHVKND